MSDKDQNDKWKTFFKCSQQVTIAFSIFKYNGKIHTKFHQLILICIPMSIDSTNKMRSTMDRTGLKEALDGQSFDQNNWVKHDWPSRNWVNHWRWLIESLIDTRDWRGVWPSRRVLINPSINQALGSNQWRHPLASNTET